MGVVLFGKELPFGIVLLFRMVPPSMDVPLFKEDPLSMDDPLFTLAPLCILVFFCLCPLEPDVVVALPALCASPFVPTCCPPPWVLFEVWEKPIVAIVLKAKTARVRLKRMT